MTDNKGFTLIEFLIAVVILMVGLLGMLQCINLAMGKNSETLFRNEALVLANDRIMLMKAKKFESLSTATVSSVVARSPRGVVLKNYSVNEVVTQITNSSLATGLPASKKIDVRISWQYKNNRYTHDVSSILSTTSME